MELEPWLNNYAVHRLPLLFFVWRASSVPRTWKPTSTSSRRSHAPPASPYLYPDTTGRIACIGRHPRVIDFFSDFEYTLTRGLVCIVVLYFLCVIWLLFSLQWSFESRFYEEPPPEERGMIVPEYPTQLRRRAVQRHPRVPAAADPPAPQQQQLNNNRRA